MVGRGKVFRIPIDTGASKFFKVTLNRSDVERENNGT